MKSKKTLSWFGRLALWINIFLLLSLLGSYLAEYTDPAQFWPLAFLGLAYPFLWALNLLFVFFWLLRGRWYSLLSLVAMAWGYKEFSRTFSLGALSPVARTHKGIQVKVMTYNVHSFHAITEPDNPQVRLDMLQLIRHEMPDILAIQEFYTRRKGSYAMEDSLRKILHNPYLYYHAVDSGTQESEGMALFSRFPLDHIQLIGFDRTGTVNGVIQANVHLPHRTITVFSVHLQSIVFQPVDYAYLNRVETKIKPDLLSSKRIVHKLKVAFIKRAAQALQLRKAINEARFPVVVMGDFNDTPVSFAYRTVQGNLQSCFAEKGFGFGRTYNGSFPNFQIDHILCDPSFNVLSVEIIPKKLSDHYPVQALISVREHP